MPIEKFSKGELFTHLEKLGVKPGSDVLVHCAMFAFGHFEGGERGLFNALFEYLGKTSTVAVPTFTLWMDKSEVYTEDTPSQRMGQLAEYCRLLEGAVRSCCPMHNHAAFGPKAYKLKRFDGYHSTGVGSDFEWFYEDRFHNLFLGCTPEESGTFLIHIEALAGVPYRDWITLERPVKWNAETEKVMNVKYFARRKLQGYVGDDIGVRVHLNHFQQVLLDKKVLKQESLPLGKSYFGAISEIQDTMLAELALNPCLALESTG